MRRILVALALLAGLISVSASAQAAGPHYGRMAFVHHQSPSTLHVHSR